MYSRNNVSVLRWIRAFGQEVKELNREKQQIEMVEVDEMHSYIGSKKTVLDIILPVITGNLMKA